MRHESCRMINRNIVCKLRIIPLGSKSKKILENSSFIDESIDVPPLENLPDLSEFPSFLGKGFGDRQ